MFTYIVYNTPKRYHRLKEASGICEMLLMLLMMMTVCMQTAWFMRYTYIVACINRSVNVFVLLWNISYSFWQEMKHFVWWCKWYLYIYMFVRECFILSLGCCFCCCCRCRCCCLFFLPFATCCSSRFHFRGHTQYFNMYLWWKWLNAFTCCRQINQSQCQWSCEQTNFKSKHSSFPNLRWWNNYCQCEKREKIREWINNLFSLSLLRDKFLRRCDELNNQSA